MKSIYDELAKIEKVIERGPFTASWDSLEAYKVPKWYEDAKFGIFIHWGVYSVPAFASEWYPRNMYVEGSPEYEHHIKTYGPHNKFGYKDFIPMFKAERWNPDQWADLFKKAGARFVMPVAEHHDGYAMYDCAFHDWTSVKTGPHRDILGELSSALKKCGIKFTCSSHREEHWWFYDAGMNYDSDVRDEAYRSLYGPARPETDRPTQDWLEEWLVYTCEIIDKYRPLVLWFDWWIKNPAYQPYLQKLASYCYNRAAEWGIEVAINYKENTFRDGTAVFDIERGQMTGIRPTFWQTDTAIAKNSWGYTHGQDYKSASSIIGDLVDIVSKNGAMLLNIGPRPDGTIPADEEQVLLDIGKWLDVNGEAIYGSRPWKQFGEGPTQVVEGTFNDVKRSPFTCEDIRFTTKSDILYAIVMEWPASGKVIIRSLAKGEIPSIGKIELLGSSETIRWTWDDNDLTIYLGETCPVDYAVVLKVSPS